MNNHSDYFNLKIEVDDVCMLYGIVYIAQQSNFLQSKVHDVQEVGYVLQTEVLLGLRSNYHLIDVKETIAQSTGPNYVKSWEYKVLAQFLVLCAWN